MYGFDETTGKGEGGRIPAGITENVMLKDVVYDTMKADGDGNKVLKFIFTDDASNSFTHTEWPIDYDELLEKAKSWKDTTAEAEAYVKDQFTAQGERIKHILSCFIPKDKCVFRAKNYDEFCNGVIELLGQAYVNTPCRIKIVYKHNSQYTTFPKRAYQPFIQPMNEPNRLRIDPKWDNMKPTVPDTSNDEWSATATAETTTAEETQPW